MIRFKKKEWLIQKYINEELSTYQIAKLCNMSQANIRKYFKKYNIPSRSIGEANHLARGNHCDLSQEAIEWINGELLGDGCIISQSSYSAKFEYISKYKEYIRYISDTLKLFKIKSTYKQIKQKRWDRELVSYNCQSRNYAELLPIRKKWYPEGKKIVPRDIKLTPLTVRQWYIGDGCLIHQKKKKPHISLYTNGFTIFDVNYLIKELNNINIKAKRQQSSNIINISVHSIIDFLKYIGDCPVKCYQYKWAY